MVRDVIMGHTPELYQAVVEPVRRGAVCIIDFAATRTSMRLLALLIASVGTLITTEAHAGSITIANSTDTDQTYDISFKIGNDSFFVTTTLPKKSDDKVASSTVGGDNSDFPVAKGKEIEMPKVSRAGGPFAALTINPDDTAIGASQSATLFAAANGTSTVSSFFDFSTPNFKELIANTDFNFLGFDSNHNPILTQVGTDTPITNSSGQLLSQFQFTGSTEVVGTVLSPAVPEPASLVMLGTGALGVLGAAWRRRRRAAA